MRVVLASVGHRSRGDRFDSPFRLYCDRIAAYATLDTAFLRTEEALFEFVERQRKRIPALVALLDSEGTALTSLEFSEWMAARRDSGQQTIVFCVGPPDGWSEDARKLAQFRLSLGPMTLPHELARLVLAEQLYRAFTILAGHPYHTGH